MRNNVIVWKKKKEGIGFLGLTFIIEGIILLSGLVAYYG